MKNIFLALLALLVVLFSLGACAPMAPDMAPVEKSHLRRIKPGQDWVRISGRIGGFLKPSIGMYQPLMTEGRGIILDGICASSCTIVLDFARINKICVTPNAVLFFHSVLPWDLKKSTNRSGTDFFRQTYPGGIKTLFDKKVGYNTKVGVYYLTGLQIAELGRIPLCERDSYEGWKNS